MATAIQNKFHWNEDREQWERVEKVQTYRGCEIASITYHDDWLLTPPDNHRGYIVTFPCGKKSLFVINKRGGNLKNLKEWIDFKIKRNDPEMISTV